MMIGLREEEGISPGWRDGRKPRFYPWGSVWPPVGKVGNLADMAADTAGSVPSDWIISGYDDGFAFTAPVGSFPANSLGLFDLSGNVQEWVEDDYSKLGKSLLGVLRGGCWITGQSENLLAGSRNAVPPDFQDAIYGFRVVLAKVPMKPEN
jgi:formylglycine-generating enzyme required for sulfatase activity